MSKEYIEMLKQERQVLLDRYDPYNEGTGHFNTAVSVLTARIEELESPTKLKESSVWVLVEAIQSYRLRYMVEAPATNPEYAMDDVTCEECGAPGKTYTDGWHTTLCDIHAAMAGREEEYEYEENE